MAGAFAGIHYLTHVKGMQPIWLLYLKAFTEAAMVGALADWFAVTALFRHPLGIPIPHTAIVPNNKERIGKNLGAFIQNNLLSDQVIHSQVSSISGWLLTWVSDDDNKARLVRRIRRTLPRVFEAFELGEIQRLVDGQVEGFVRKIPVARSVARLLRGIVSNPVHEKLAEQVVSLGRTFVKENERWISDELSAASPWFVPSFVDRKILRSIVHHIDTTLDAALRDPSHELRKRIGALMVRCVEHLESSPEVERELEELKEQLLKNPEFREFVATLRDSAIAAITRDLSSADPQIVAAIEGALMGFIDTLQKSSELQHQLDQVLRRLLTALVGDQSGHVTELVSRTIMSWDTDTVVSKIEVHVGNDLQFIRINGTLVGGIVGVVLFFLQRL
jgi:uncharacterized membrane-anchored protein YjiN (DUF445 family)